MRKWQRWEDDRLQKKSVTFVLGILTCSLWGKFRYIASCLVEARNWSLWPRAMWMILKYSLCGALKWEHSCSQYLVCNLVRECEQEHLTTLCLDFSPTETLGIGLGYYISEKYVTQQYITNTETHLLFLQLFWKSKINSKFKFKKLYIYTYIFCISL
jgi:hypothetical protein